MLLFTEDLAVATVAQAYEAERIDTQITLSLQGIGLSLVNSVKNAEIAFIGIMRQIFSLYSDEKNVIFVRF